MIYSSKFRPAWWLRNPHAQTLWAARLQSIPAAITNNERLTTPDNDFLDLAWTEENEGPVVAIFHGLTGGIQSHYVQSLMHNLNALGIRAVLMHFRGCSGEPNRSRGSYHSGHTQDIEFVIDTLVKRFPNKQIGAAGFSLGGNALLKYLGSKPDNPLRFALSVSPPLALAEAAQRMNTGFSKVYQSALIDRMKDEIRAKHAKYPELGMDEFDLGSISNFIEFDHQITAPIYGFDSGAHYYETASTLGDLININTPTHILWARDDPFFTGECMPTEDQLSDHVDFELTSHGGHVAFINGKVPLAGKNWLCERASELLKTNLQ